jgi:hypothetical protein
MLLTFYQLFYLIEVDKFNIQCISAEEWDQTSFFLYADICYLGMHIYTISK